ncbi:MAG: hypothetical protein KAR42_13800 [candidate division Zixibacteria bacterium]|nr:hypothetical protein [candidate division Zixibacteria bacterium]
MSLSIHTPKIKAVGLLSGGLDSTLAAKLMIEQGIEIYAVNFTSPFCTCTPKSAGCAAVITAIRELGNIPLRLNNGNKIVVARNDHECKMLGNLTRRRDHLLVPQDFVGPSVLLSGALLDSAVEKMLRYTKKPVKEKARITHLHDGKKETISVQWETAG